MENSIFRKESIQSVSSPEQLNDYIKVSGVSVWLIIAAAFILLAAALVWSVVGSLTTTLKTTGFAENGCAVCYVEDAGALTVGSVVSFSDGTKGTVSEIAASPLSKNEVTEKYADSCNDFALYSLELSEWNYAVTIASPNTPDGFVSAELTAESVHPISFIWN